MTQNSHAIAPAFAKLPKLTISNRRWLLRGLSGLLRATRCFYRWSANTDVRRHRVIGRDNNAINIIEIAPKGLSSSAPAIVYYHGGGFFLTYGRGHLRQVESYAQKLQVRVFFVPYRLATQAPFPAPFDDCHAAFNWVYDNAEQLQVNRQRIAVMGDSAGGCLAAAVAQAAYDQHRPPHAQFLIYPVIDWRCHSASATQFTDTPIWNARNNQIMWHVYLGQQPALGEQPPPYASPITREDCSGLAPAYIESAEFDPLRDEAKHYADALTSSGVAVQYTQVGGAVHGYDFVDCDITRQAMATRLAAMKQLLCD
jgi:acetyl esterase/lipase